VGIVIICLGLGVRSLTGLLGDLVAETIIVRRLSVRTEMEMSGLMGRAGVLWMK